MVKTIGNPEGRILLQRRILSAIVAILFALSLFCLSFVAVFGQSSYSTGIGFLRFAPDAEHQGIGRIGTGERHNTNAAFWNIAAAAPEYSSTASVDPPSNPEHIVLSAQLPPIGIRGALLAFGTLQGIRLGRGSLTVSGTYFRIFPNNVTEYTVSVGYAQPLSEEVSMGIQMKFVQSNIPFDSTGRTFDIGRTGGLDIGIMYTPTLLFGASNAKQVSFGATLKNVGPSITYTRAADPQPVEFRAGVAAEVLREEAHTVRLLGDAAMVLVNRTISGSYDAVPTVLVTGWRNPLEISLGGEYSYQQTYFVRAGYFEDFVQYYSFRRLSVGAGVRLDNVAIVDMAADIPLRQDPMSAMSAVSLTVRVPITAGL